MRSLNFIISGHFHCHLSDTYQINATIRHYYRSTYRNSITHIYRCCVTCYFQFNILVRRKSTKKTRYLHFRLLPVVSLTLIFFLLFFFSLLLLFIIIIHLTYIALVWSVLDVGCYIFFPDSILISLHKNISGFGPMCNKTISRGTGTYDNEERTKKI